MSISPVLFTQCNFHGTTWLWLLLSRFQRSLNVLHPWQQLTYTCWPNSTRAHTLDWITFLIHTACGAMIGNLSLPIWLDLGSLPFRKTSPSLPIIYSVWMRQLSWWGWTLSVKHMTTLMNLWLAASRDNWVSVYGCQAVNEWFSWLERYYVLYPRVNSARWSGPSTLNKVCAMP